MGYYIIRTYSNGKLTKTQKEVLKIIQNFIKTNGYSPTVRELSSLTGKSSKRVHDHLRALRIKEYITWKQGKARTIKILKEAPDEI